MGFGLEEGCMGCWCSRAWGWELLAGREVAEREGAEMESKGCG
jgi:hypothetical protein